MSQQLAFQDEASEFLGVKEFGTDGPSECVQRGQSALALSRPGGLLPLQVPTRLLGASPGLERSAPAA
jgi:hypothetical protein